MKVPMLDLRAQYAAIKPVIDRVVSEVMESQQFILGAPVQACERALSEYAGCSFGVGVSSGTDALLMCLMAEGIGRGDEVITTPYTFFATAGAIARLGATPVFVDIDPVTYNLDTSQIAAKVTDRTRAIIPVHLYGQTADMGTLMEVAQKHGLVVIEDAAQALGAEYENRRAGSFGDFGCFSFFPSKNLGGAGDGGLIVTNDRSRRDKLVCLRAHGSESKYRHRMLGGNFRLDALQAAIVAAKLPFLDEWTVARQNNAQRYNELFMSSGIRVSDTARYADSRRLAGEGHLRDRWAIGTCRLYVPQVVTNRHIFNQYVIRVARRDQLRAALREKGVETEIYYPVPMHLQECFSYLGYVRGCFPESEKAAEETLALPVYPELSEDQACYVVEIIKDFYAAES